MAHLATAAVTGVARRGGKQGTGAAADAAAVLEGAVWGAMTAFQQWRVGLLLLSLVANFTGMLLAKATDDPSACKVCCCVCGPDHTSACAFSLHRVLGMLICQSYGHSYVALPSRHLSIIVQKDETSWCSIINSAVLAAAAP